MEDDRAEVAIVVSVDPARFDAAEQALAAAGVTVDQQFREIGAIGGYVREDRLSTLHELTGVLTVERERLVEQPPPDSELQ